MGTRMKALFPDFAIRAGPATFNLRERVEKYGVEALATAELLELLLCSDRRRQETLRVSLSQVHLREIAMLHQREIEHLLSLTPREALIIKLALELAKRLEVECQEQRSVITSAADVANLLMPEMRHLDREHLRVVCLNTRNQVLRVAPVSVGTVNSALAHPREVLRAALVIGAVSVILVHNHPSGDPTPSSEDLQLTRQIAQAGGFVGIETIDHIIIGQGCFVSLREQNLI